MFSGLGEGEGIGGREGKSLVVSKEGESIKVALWFWVIGNARHNVIMLLVLTGMSTSCILWVDRQPQGVSKFEDCKLEPWLTSVLYSSFCQKSYLLSFPLIHSFVEMR